MRKRTALVTLAAVGSVVALALASCWLAGVIFLMSVKRSPSLAQPFSIVRYWQAYGDDALLARRLRSASVLAGLLCFVGVPAAVLAARHRRRPLHGDARFARREEIVKAGLLGEDGIVLGKLGDRFLMLSGQQFVLLCAPTRSGKGVGCVIPNLLSWGGSAVVNDLKGEVHKATAGFRARYQSVHVWDPFSESGQTHRFNPLAYVRAGVHAVGDALSIAHVIYPHNDRGVENENFFTSQARNLFVGLFLMVRETPSRPLTLGELLRQSSGQGRPLKSYLTQVLKERREAGVPLSDACRDALMRFLSCPDNTLGSVLATFNAPLTMFANPLIDAATSDNDFDLRELRRRLITVYVRIPANKLADAKVILNLFWTVLVNLNTRDLPEDDPSLRHQVLLVLDEFPALGRMEMLSKGVGYLAGYNLRFLTIAQSIGQLNDIYGRDAARAFATNHAAQIVFAPREQHDANEYSEMLGFLTDVSVSRGTSSGAGRSGAGRSTNRSEARRALMLPQELKEMGEARQIVLYERCKPVLADKIFYYRDPVLSKRLLPAPPVPRIDIDLVIARAQGRVRPATADDLGSSSRELASRLAHNFADLPPVSDGMTREQQVAFVRAFFDAMPTVDGRLEAAPDTQGEAGASALADAGSGDGGEGRQVAAKPDLGVELMSAG